MLNTPARWAPLVAGLVLVLMADVSWPADAAPAKNYRQVVVPFTGVERPAGVAVDGSGAVYTTDAKSARVLKLAGGATATLATLSFKQTRRPVQPTSIVVDARGDVYVSYHTNGGQMDGVVVKLADGRAPTELVNVVANDLAVDHHGNLYLTEMGIGGVQKLPPGSAGLTSVPVADLTFPQGVAVDGDGDLYLTTNARLESQATPRVAKVTAGSGTPTGLPFAGLGDSVGVAVDSDGAVYVSDTDHHRVLMLPAGSDTPSVLPFTGLQHPAAVAVDGSGSVYVADDTRVVELVAG